jgi:hypothetical protein
MGRQQGWNMDYTQEELFAVDLSQDTVTLSSDLQTTYSLSNIDLTTSSITLAQPWVTTTNGSGGFTWANLTEPASGKITLQGPNADIEVNGESLMSAIHRIEERLNILRPNEKLEAEWDQLRELGEQYRALEKKLNEQSEMWDALKKMPPPEIK